MIFLNIFLLHEQLRTIFFFDALLWLDFFKLDNFLSLNSIRSSIFYFRNAVKIFFYDENTLDDFKTFSLLIHFARNKTVLWNRAIWCEYFFQKKIFIHPKVGNFNIIKITAI